MACQVPALASLLSAPLSTEVRWAPWECFPLTRRPLASAQSPPSPDQSPSHSEGVTSSSMSSWLPSSVRPYSSLPWFPASFHGTRTTGNHSVVCFTPRKVRCWELKPCLLCLLLNRQYLELWLVVEWENKLRPSHSSFLPFLSPIIMKVSKKYTTHQRIYS